MTDGASEARDGGSSHATGAVTKKIALPESVFQLFTAYRPLRHHRQEALRFLLREAVMIQIQTENAAGPAEEPELVRLRFLRAGLWTRRALRTKKRPARDRTRS